MLQGRQHPRHCRHCERVAGIVKGLESKRVQVCDCLRGTGVFNGQQHSGQFVPFNCREGRNIRLQLLKQQPLLPTPLKASFQAFTHLSRRRRPLGCGCGPPPGQTAATRRPASGAAAPQPVQWEVAQQMSYFGPEMQAAAQCAADGVLAPQSSGFAAEGVYSSWPLKVGAPHLPWLLLAEIARGEARKKAMPAPCFT